MNQLIRFCFYFGIILFMSYCSKKAVSVAVSDKNYEEDLSELKPRYEFKEEAPVNEQLVVNVKSPEMDNTELVNEKLDLISEKNKSIKYTQGYRILVYSGNSKETAEKAREIIYQVFPDSKPEVKYQQPNFKVKVGDYYDRLEAHMILTRLKEFFPQALIIPEKISIK